MLGSVWLCCFWQLFWLFERHRGTGSLRHRTPLPSEAVLHQSACNTPPKLLPTIIPQLHAPCELSHTNQSISITIDLQPAQSSQPILLTHQLTFATSALFFASVHGLLLLSFRRAAPRESISGRLMLPLPSRSKARNTRSSAVSLSEFELCELSRNDCTADPTAVC